MQKETNKEKETIIRTALDSLSQTLYSVKSVESVNHKPHLYIGA